MPSGTGVFYPNARFAFPRSYVWGFDLRVDTDVTQDGRFFHFPDGGLPSRIFTVSLYERVFDWSSNRYTLDFCIEDSYYQNFPDPTPILMNYGFGYEDIYTPGRPVFVFYPFNLPFVDPHRFELPPAPPDYWMPPFE